MKLPPRYLCKQTTTKPDMPLVWHKESLKIFTMVCKNLSKSKRKKAHCKVFIGRRRLENSPFTTQNSLANIQ